MAKFLCAARFLQYGPIVWLFAFCALFLPGLDAWAAAFWLDPNPVAAPWGRILWNSAPNGAPPGGGANVLTLDYAFFPKVQNVNLVFKEADGTLVPVPLNNSNFSDAEKKAINAAAGTWNAAVANPAAAKQGNLRGADLGGKVDLQSTATHEWGHVLGLDEPNSGTTYNPNASPQVVRPSKAKNVNVVNAAGNPDRTLTLPRADQTNLAQSNTLQQVAFARPLPGGIGGTEAVMVQGAFPDEIQRDLASDDMQGLFALESGRDFKWSTADDYTFSLVEAALEGPRVINLINVDEATLRLLGGLAVTQAGFDNVTNPNNFTHMRMYFDSAIDPLTGEGTPISMTEVLFTGDLNSLSTEAGFVNVLINADALFVPEPSSVALVALALAILTAFRWKERTRRVSARSRSGS